MTSALLESVLPLVRAARYAAHGTFRYRPIISAAARPSPDDDEPISPTPAFVIGCGRSGTTLLSDILSSHPRVCYLFEPYYLWNAVDPATDMINFFGAHDAKCLLGSGDATPEARRRLWRMMRAARRRDGRARLIEKTPINALRVGYLNALVPGANYLHLVRDGVQVARSISRLANTAPYRGVVGKPEWNPWWGRRSCKWRFLAADGAAAGYFPDEVGRLTNDVQRGAYEWIVSLSEIDRHRAALGDRLMDLSYARLTSDPSGAIRNLTAFFGLEGEAAPDRWFERSVALVGRERKAREETVALPPFMAAAFNQLQDRFGFGGRAEPAGAA